MKSWLFGTGSSLGWADLVVVPLIAVLSVPPLLWFWSNWTLTANDTARYLLAGSQLLTGDAFENLNTISGYNGGHGPGVPALVAFFIILFGRDTVALVWALRLVALLGPLLVYLLAKRISTPVAGLIAASLVSLLGFNVQSTVAINIDALQLTFYLLSLLALFAAVERGGIPLAALSGVLLGFAILTKETAIVDLPLALLAVLLLDWDLRGALWHYLGVALVCLPWWIFVYLLTAEVYLVGVLPAVLRGVILVAAAISLILAALAYASGRIERFLEDERRRRWSGWILVLVWTVALTGMLLSTASHTLGNVTFGDVRLFLAEQLLAPVIVVVPAFFAAAGYVAWKASFQENGAWRLLALALLFQMPVCLLLTVQRWATRQFLVPQTLVLCILAALLVAVAATAWGGRDSLHRIAGLAGAAVLTIVLLASSIQTVRALLPEDLVDGLARQEATPLANAMVDWMAENVPDGERILMVSEPSVNVPQANYLMYLDGGRHEWTRLRLDQGICAPRPNVQINCDTEQNSISRIPPDALWVQTIGGSCKVLSLSTSNLLRQSRQSGADYVAVAGNAVFPEILGLPPALRASRLFDLAHANLFLRSATGVKQGVVLLRGTGQTPEAVPTWMNTTTAFGLQRCERAQGPGYEDRLDSAFPNGVTGPGGPFDISQLSSEAP